MTTEGAAFVSREPRRWRLVGRDPLLSCVPIEPLRHLTPAVSARSREVAVFRLTEE